MAEDVEEPPIKVFCSHRSVDKPRVLQIARQLRAAWIDAWVADWEIRPGDDFVARINEGLAACSIGLVFFSRRSLESPWVEAEVDTLTHFVVEKEKRVIPMLLDPGIDVPPLLRTRLSLPADSVEALIAAIYGDSEKPPLEKRRKREMTGGPGPQEVGVPTGRSPLPPVDRVFVGREAELEKLAGFLFGSEGIQPVAICALQGMPGVGKTYLAEQFAAIHAAVFPGSLVRLVLEPTQPDSLSPLRLLGDLADRLEVSAAADGLAERVRSALLAPRALLLIENVDSPAAAAAVAPLARWLSGCLLLVTGRYRELGRIPGSGWRCLDLSPLAETLALEQLRQELGDVSHPPSETDCRELVRELGCLPLAVHWAAGYLRRRRSVESFLGLLKRQKLAVPPLDAADLQLQGRGTLAAVFEISLKLLGNGLGKGKKRRLAGFGALGFAPAGGFGASLGAALADLPVAEFEELAFQAEALSLLDPVADRPDTAWKVHPLLAELLRDQNAAQARPALDRMTDWFVERLAWSNIEADDGQGQKRKEVHRETAALMAWLPQVPAGDRARVERAGSWYAMLSGPYSAWIAFCESALAGELSAGARSNFLWTLAKTAVSGGLLERALEAAKTQLKLDTDRGAERDAALAAGVIADILKSRGQLDEALRIHQEEEFPVYEKLGDIWSRAVTMGKIADILKSRGQLDEALRIHQEEELPVYEKLGDIRSRAVTMGKIADILILLCQSEVLPRHALAA